MSPQERRLVAIYADEDVTDLLAPLLRERGFQALSTAEADNFGLTDEEQLEFATLHQHAMLTYNRDDFIFLARRWYDQGREHAGIILSPQFRRREVGELLRQISNLLKTVPAEEMWNTVRHLQSFR
jgi:hypothetical protein